MARPRQVMAPRQDQPTEADREGQLGAGLENVLGRREATRCAPPMGMKSGRGPMDVLRMSTSPIAE
jgi:hypothetical protein